MIRFIEGVLWLALLLLLSLFVGQASAHSWYEPSCCGGNDCAPMSADEYVYDDGHIVILETGERVPLDQTRPSQDGAPHRCVYLYGERAGRTRTHHQGGFCVYVPGAM